jgi:hypothetical protein
VGKTAGIIRAFSGNYLIFDRFKYSFTGKGVRNVVTGWPCDHDQCCQ